MPRTKKQSTEAAVREIRRRTRRKFAPEEKIRIEAENPATEEESGQYGRGRYQDGPRRSDKGSNTDRALPMHCG